MMADTSPSIADIGGVGYIAFQASTGSLWGDTNGNGGASSLSTMADTSPSITALG